MMTIASTRTRIVMTASRMNRMASAPAQPARAFHGCGHRCNLLAIRYTSSMSSTIGDSTSLLGSDSTSVKKPHPRAIGAHDFVAHVEGLSRLGDFTTTRRVLPISALAVCIGVFAAYVAAGLLKLIGLFTNLFFFQRVSTALVTPEAHTLGPFVILVPVAGALVIGVMARYGSERIRGHGIPEAIEAILIGGSRVEPKVAVLKPVSSAISIGSGGPFGAEGPIIMTGGAVGSLFAQCFHMSAAERKTLLVAGAAAGMTAIFGTPLAAVLLAVELLLFEWKPRSLI